MITLKKTVMLFFTPGFGLEGIFFTAIFALQIFPFLDCTPFHLYHPVFFHIPFPGFMDRRFAGFLSHRLSGTPFFTMGTPSLSD
jgi:hypothetical protein